VYMLSAQGIKMIWVMYSMHKQFYASVNKLQAIGLPFVACLCELSKLDALLAKSFFSTHTEGQAQFLYINGMLDSWVWPGEV